MIEPERASSAEDVFAEYLATRESSAGTSIEDWVRRYPQYADELRGYERDWGEFEAGLEAALSDSRLPETLFHRLEALPPDIPGPSQDYPVRPGSLIGDYRLIRMIAQGGMGHVWEALQLSLKRPVALKFMREDRITPRSIAFFEREARAGGRLSHPGIVAVYATGQTQGLRWIAQELVPGGGTLRTFLDDVRAEGHRPSDYEEKVAELFIALTDALQIAHDAGVIHRDLKPQNILIASNDHPKITDFGLARLVDEASVSGQISLEGTPHYMSPEQALAKIEGIDSRTDIFSLGAILYEMLTLHRPFEAETQIEIFDRILNTDPQDPHRRNHSVSVEMAAISLKALEKRRQDRYPTMREFGDDLRRFLRNEPLRAKPPGILRRVRKWTRRHPTLATGAALGVLLLGGGIWATGEIQRSQADALQRRKENLVVLAGYAIENAQLAEMERLMVEYEAVDAADFMPHLVRAQAYVQFQYTAEAERQFGLAQEKGFDPTELDDLGVEDPDPHELYLSGLSLIIRQEQQDRERAADLLREALRLDPFLRAAYFPLYRLCKQLGDLDGARRALEDFQKVLPTGDDYYPVVKAMRAELDGEFNTAIGGLVELSGRVSEERQKELRLDASLGRLYIKLARESKKDECLDAAEAHLLKAVDFASTDASSWGNLGLVAYRSYLWDMDASGATQHLEDAARFGERAMEEYGNLALGHEVLLAALTLQATHDFSPFAPRNELFDRAEEVARELRRLDPGNEALAIWEAEIFFHRGMVAEAEGDAEAVENYFRRSVELNPRQVNPRVWLAVTYYFREDFEASLEQVQAARHWLADKADIGGRISKLPDVLRAKLHIWAFGTGSAVGTQDGIGTAQAARADIDAHLREGRAVEPIELLNYVEFLASSSTVELRDCQEAERIFSEFELEQQLAPTYAEAVDAVIELLDSCD